MEIIIDRILAFIFVLAVIDVIREAGTFINCIRTLTPYSIGVTRMTLMWLSIAYIINIIIFGF